MNDPGLDEPAQQAAEHVEHDAYEAEHKQAEREKQDFLDPSRWWFASTASPLIAGTFGPMANAFSICALVEKWREHIPPGVVEGEGSKVDDPKWLIAINSVSLVFALTANAALLLNMGRRLSFAIAQPITIVGWYIASVLLVALVAVASSSAFRLQPRAEHALSQAYYYAIMAAGVYFIVASMMCMTVYGAHKGHYPKEFRLTASQRTLMLQTISFMFYLLLGALVFSVVESWRFLDAVYWADFTVLTVGLDSSYTPTTHTGRSLYFPYAFGGIVIVGLVIGSVRSLILERGKQKLSARFIESKRQSVLSSIDNETRTIKLGPFEKITYSEKGLSESQRREQEFRVMRRIQELAQRNRKYTALALSTTASLLLWFLGALVFMYTERSQGWTYFVSMYFAYTSLLTIGYGDFTPSSNAGKAFFVFWSLLAVPTLTILISNMGDTVIKAFKDLTIWIGSLTILPDETGLIETLKIGLKRLRLGKLYKKQEDHKKDAPKAIEQSCLDRLAEHIKGDELAATEDADEYEGGLNRDVHFYHFVLAKEIRQLMRDIDASPPREYTFPEWSYYLRLIGQDEADRSGHRKPKIKYARNERKAPDLGTADNGEDTAWSWLGLRSPLMGNQTEAQWLLDRLTSVMEVEMSKMRSPKVDDKPPPISMKDLKKRDRSKSNSKHDIEKDVGAAELRRRGSNDV